MQNLPKTFDTHKFTLPDEQYLVKIPNGQFPNCTNCLDDAYDIDQTNYIYKKKHGSLP